MTRTTLTDQRYRELTDMPKFRRVQILNGDPALMDAYRDRVRAAAASIDRRRAREDRERENMQITRERAAEIAADLTASSTTADAEIDAMVCAHRANRALAPDGTLDGAAGLAWKIREYEAYRDGRIEGDR